MKRVLKWQKEILDRIPNMSNEEVFYRYSDLNGGDTYDGCFTIRGEWEYKKITEELMKRLVESGFLKQEKLRPEVM